MVEYTREGYEAFVEASRILELDQKLFWDSTRRIVDESLLEMIDQMGPEAFLKELKEHLAFHESQIDFLASM